MYLGGEPQIITTTPSEQSVRGHGEEGRRDLGGGRACVRARRLPPQEVRAVQLVLRSRPTARPSAATPTTPVRSPSPARPSVPRGPHGRPGGPVDAAGAVAVDAPRHRPADGDVRDAPAAPTGHAVLLLTAGRSAWTALRPGGAARTGRGLDRAVYLLSEAANHSMLWHGINLVDAVDRRTDPPPSSAATLGHRRGRTGRGERPDQGARRPGAPRRARRPPARAADTAHLVVPQRARVCGRVRRDAADPRPGRGTAVVVPRRCGGVDTGARRRPPRERRRRRARRSGRTLAGSPGTVWPAPLTRADAGRSSAATGRWSG